MSAGLNSCSLGAARVTRRCWSFVAIAAVLALLLSVPAHSQSLGEIARRERERKANRQAAPSHVYTNDDLERQHILVPQDQESVEIPREPNPSATAPTPGPETAQTEPDQTIVATATPAPAPPASLGEIARHERRRKASKANKVAHVYTNQDLRRRRILVPEDVQRVEEAKKQSHPHPAAAPQETARVNATTEGESLGEIARRYRASEAVGPNADPAQVPAQIFHLPAGGAILAYPNFQPPVATTSPVPARPSAATRAAGKSHASPAPPPGTGVAVRIRPGDSLWRLARRYLGRGQDWKVIAASNPQLKNPDRLPVGTLLRLPDSAASAR